MNLPITEQQLFWLEELPLEYFVELRVQPKGIPDLDNNPPLITTTIQLKDLSSYREKYYEHNIWRSWSIYTDAKQANNIGPVPLFFDIDDESEPPKLENAHIMVVACLDFLQKNTGWKEVNERLRVIFSGRKGFHIEIKPPFPINADELRKQLLSGLEHLGLKNIYANRFIEKTVLDLLSPTRHPWVRITNSLYSWCSKSGDLVSRKVIEIPLVKFHHLKPEEIIKMAEAPPKRLKTDLGYIN